MSEVFFPRPPVTQFDLESSMCDDPGCLEDHELYIVQGCHPGAGLEVMYTKSTGEMRITCILCQGLVDNFLLAKGGDTDERSHS